MAENEEAPLTARARPQFHYFYGSTGQGGEDDAMGSPVEGVTAEQEQESLIGEELVSTDHELDTPNGSEQDLQHLVITNGNRSAAMFKPWTTFNGNGQSSSGSSFYNIFGRLIAIILLAIAMGSLLVLLFPHTSEPIPPAQAIYIPFPPVDRNDYGDPVEGFIDMDLFHPSLISPTTPRTFVFAFPTGAFWTNLVVPPPTEDLSYPIAVYPYAYKWSKTELQVSYPSSHRFTTKIAIQDTFAPDLTFSSTEDIEQRYVTKFDPLSVTIRFSSATQSKWESVLVQGSPYVTLKFLSATPTIRALSIFKTVQCPGDDDENFSDIINDVNPDDGRRQLFGVCSIDDAQREETILRGVQFSLKTAEGMSWIMFASEPITLSYDAISKTTVSGLEPFTGIIRLALIPPTESSDANAVQLDSSTGLRRLIYHAGVYPVGGDVAWDFRSSSTAKGQRSDKAYMATVHFNFVTRTMTDDSLRPNAGLLMLGLPHHAKKLSKGTKLSWTHFDVEYKCIKGTLTPIVGSSWSYDEHLPDLEFDGPLQGWESGVKSQILAQVGKDIDRVLPTRAENIYGFGKQVARLAQLAHISHNLGDVNNGTMAENTDDDSALLKKAHDLLWSNLEMLLSGEVGDALLYDSNLGGIVSTNGLYDSGEDFGNGRYNDHHFHYGYILYASAIMAKVNETFIDAFGPHVDALFYDVAHRSSGDSRSVPNSSLFFPLARHKSWFDGHSFATGMFSFGNGKSQESSSEAVNCYYGAYLWSLIRHESASSDLTDYTRLLLAMEITGAKNYWHMMPPDSQSGNHSSPSADRVDVYDASFASNYMVGNVGMLDVACNTWFGSDPLFIHMINALPITAITAILFDEDYVSAEYKYLMRSRSSVEMAWRGYVISIHSLIDPVAAWEDAQDLVSYELDAAISKSQVLYFISNRDGFELDTSSKTEGGHKGSPTQAPSGGGGGGDGSSSSCASNPRCQALGLSGICCPTGDGTFLGCCS